jgi:hypothetical protein
MINQRGFSLIEALVAVVMATIFILAMVELYVVQLNLSTSTASYEQADQLAYNNMRAYADGTKPIWFECNYTGTNTTPDPWPLIVNKITQIKGIPGDVVQNVISTAPFGCGNGGGKNNSGYPILVTSTVTYNGRTVAHATYSSY